MLIALLLLALTGAAAAQDLEAHLRAVLEAEPSIRVRTLSIGERAVTIGLELAPRIPLDDLPPEVENRLEIAAGAVSALRPSVDAINLLVAHPNERLRPPPVRARERSGEREVVKSEVRDPSRFPYGQALLGKTVALSPGHGWIYYDALGRFGTQRSNIRWTGCGDCRGIVEDFETHEIVIRHLIPLLEGAGARVVLVRERDYSDQGAIADDGDAGYVESSGTFAPGASEGGNGGDYRTSFDPGATAEWTLTAPARGEQLLSLWFVSGTNRLADALLEVDAPGGRHQYVFDLTGLGRRWTPIELFDVESGATITARLSAPAISAGDRALIADGLRIGAGQHSSGHPWWQMGSQPFAVYQAASADVQSRGDVTARPRYAEFYGADIFVSVHSNASGLADSTAAGTSTYRYSCGAFPDHSNPPDPSACDDPPGSDRLQSLVHQYVVDQLRADWDQSWVDRGPKVADFGELRELDGIPGILIETAFHDNVRLAAGSSLRVTDNQALHDARWRRATAFGIYRGISEYLVGAGTLVPPPPDALAVKRIDRTSVALTFSPVAEASGYRVLVAAGGRTFDRGRLVETSSVVIDGLPEGAPISVKVSSLNAAGEGIASRAVVARTSGRPAQVLIVDAFQREDAWVQDYDNRGDTSIAHGIATAATSYAFDGATESALAGGLIDLEGYDGVVLALGRESTEHGVLTPELRDRLAAYVAAGGALFASGSEVAYALDAAGDDASRAFLQTVFGVLLARDDAAAGGIAGAAGAWLETVASPLATFSSSGLLETRSSDVLAPMGAAVVELVYQGGTDAAAVRSDRNLVLGFALDSVADFVARERIIGAWLENTIELADEEVIVVPPMDGGVLGEDAGAIEQPDGGELEPKDAGAIEQPDAAPVDPIDLVPKVRIRGGCGCSAAGETEAGVGALLLLAIALLTMRSELGETTRRRRR